MGEDDVPTFDGADMVQEISDVTESVVLRASSQIDEAQDAGTLFYNERFELPHSKLANQKPSIWKVIKDSIGKDLTKITMPVSFNEPLSMLQKTSEFMEYEDYLVRANREPDPAMRFVYVIAFNIAQYKSSSLRFAKPFNPILGETFEFRTPRFEYIAEQVSHHPPISACYARSRTGDYECWINTEVKSKFWGTCMEVLPVGLTHIKLHDHDEIYAVQRPTTAINNLMMGTLYLDQHGPMVFTKRRIDAQSAAEVESKVVVEFKKGGGWTAKASRNAVSAAVPMRHGSDSQYKILGTWTDGFFVRNDETGEEKELWTPIPLQEGAEWQQNFTRFALQLNHLPEQLREHLPPTDVRFRPDQRALEQGDEELAASEKHRLEEKQRAARRLGAERGITHKAQYFELFEDPETGESMYKVARDYWRDRATKNWSHLPDLY